MKIGDTVWEAKWKCGKHKGFIEDFSKKTSRIIMAHTNRKDFSDTYKDYLMFCKVVLIEKYKEW